MDAKSKGESGVGEALDGGDGEPYFDRSDSRMVADAAILTQEAESQLSNQPFDSAVGEQNETYVGLDADVFLFSPDALDGIADLVLDYSLDEGDTVDLTALFDVDGGNIADFVQYDEGTGSLSVDVDGSDAGAAEVVATFTGTPVDIEVLFSNSSTPGDDTTIV